MTILPPKPPISINFTSFKFTLMYYLIQSREGEGKWNPSIYEVRNFPFPQFPSNQTECKVTMPVIRFRGCLVKAKKGGKWMKWTVKFHGTYTFTIYFNSKITSLIFSLYQTYTQWFIHNFASRLKEENSAQFNTGWTTNS